MTEYLPTAKISTLKQRALVIGEVRAFFRQQGYWEVETPILSHDIVIDQHLEPFQVATTPDKLEAKRLFLQTSPEFAMKRLLAAGAEAIFQITHAFRQGERGRYHNPEFCMLEWYRVGVDHHQQMAFVQQLIQHVSRVAQHLEPIDTKRSDWFCEIASTTEYLKLTYDDAFQRYVGTTVLDKDCGNLAALAAKWQLSVPESFNRDDQDSWLTLMLADLVEPHLGTRTPVFLYDYPAAQAALAKISERPDGIAVAERFELYIDGLELCNGYHELIDDEVFEQRMQQQSAAREMAGKPQLPTENILSSAMQHGLPVSAGVALGLDRLVMLALGGNQISDVIAFPIERA